MTVVYNDLDAGRDPEVDERVFSSRGGGYGRRSQSPLRVQERRLRPNQLMSAHSSVVLAKLGQGLRPAFVALNPTQTSEILLAQCLRCYRVLFV